MRARTFVATLAIALGALLPSLTYAEGDLYNHPTPPDPATISQLYAGQISFVATTSGYIGSTKLWFFQRNDFSTNPATITCRVFYNQFGDSYIGTSGRTHPYTDLTQTYTGVIPSYSAGMWHWGEIDDTWDENSPCVYHAGNTVIVGLTPFGDPGWLGDNIAGVVTSATFSLHESTTTQTGNIYQHTISPHFPRPSTVQPSPFGTNGEFFFYNTVGTTTLTSVSEFLLWTASGYFSQAPTQITPTLYIYKYGGPVVPLCTGTPIDTSDPSKVFSNFSRAPDTLTGYNLTFDNFQSGFYYGTVPLQFPNCTIPPTSGGDFLSISLPPTAGGSGGQLGTLRDPSIIPPAGSQGDYRWNVEAAVNGIPVASTSPTGASNVLFLPGIEGSRLYEGTGCGKSSEEKLWEPYDGVAHALLGVGDDKVKQLYLDSSGQSKCSDIYAKEDDIIDSVSGSNLYRSFIDEMNGLRADGTIADWKAVPYDWRLSLPDLLAKGAEHDGKIYYEQATSTPYIEQTLRALATSSKTGKVTIVTHSNGGLVAKALLNQLGSEASTLVDKVIMVAAPQSGAPIAMGALLYGQDQGISLYGFPILHNSVAQGLALNSPMAYHLLPSEDYLEAVAPDPVHRVATFSGSAYAHEIATYGSSIGNIAALDSFLLASTSLNSSLISYANTQHATLDFWTPPAGIEIDQIAGWGNDTVAGIDYFTLPAGATTALGPTGLYRPIFTEDGDGTVPVPSALEMASSANVKRYWLNLFAYNAQTHSSRTHKDLFETQPLENLIKNIIQNSTTLPTYIVTSQPSPQDLPKKLTFLLHSPLTLQLQDSSGNVTGLAPDNSVTQNIPGSTYGEFGDVKYITVPEGGAYHVTLHGQASGTFTLDAEETTAGVVSSLSTIAEVPTTASTTVSISIQSDLSTLSPMTIDENGDGMVDATIMPKVGGTVIFDTTPPEAKVTFDTNTKKIFFTGSDESSTTTLKMSSTSAMINDLAGNTLTLKLSQNVTQTNYALLTIPSFTYSNSITTNATSSLRYFWTTDKSHKYTLFISAIRTPTDRLIALYIPAVNKTYLLQALPTDDTSDLSKMSSQLLVRKIIKQLTGMVVPYIATLKGSVIIGY